MSVTFPQSPTNGQQVTDPVTGAMWVWNNSPLPGRWTPVNAGVISNLIDQRSMGFVNKIRNPGMDIWQRGASFNVTAGTASYTADGWVVGAIGATCPVQQGLGQLSGTSKSKGTLVLYAASGLTTCYIYQRIESFVAAPLAGQICTFQARILNITTVPVQLQFATYYPAAPDNYSNVVNDISGINLQSVPAGASAIVAYTFPVTSNALNGYTVQFTINNALNATTGYVAITDVDLRAAPGVSLGLNANPPPVELRPIAVEMVNCQRYYFQDSGNSPGQVWFMGNVTSGGIYNGLCRFPVRMRVVPSVKLTSTYVAGFPSTSGAVWGSGVDGVIEARTANASGAYVFASAITASAEL